MEEGASFGRDLSRLVKDRFVFKIVWRFVSSKRGWHSIEKWIA